MLRLLGLTVVFFLITVTAIAQDAVGAHEIKKGVESNEYIIKTTITGLEGVDIARATYNIDDVHTYKKIVTNELFSSRDKEYIKFYVMGIPEAGIITIELGLILANNGSYSFPVEFQYSRNDEKKIVQFPALLIEGDGEVLALNAPIEKEQTIITDSVNTALSDMEESTLAASTKNGSVSAIKKASIKPETTIKEELADTKVVYTIQLLSLSKFSQARFDAYCDKHSLLPEEVSTRIVNGMTKVIYGKASSLEEAKKLIDRLKLLNNIDGAFAVPL